MSAHEFSIPVSDLDAGGKEFQFPVRAAWVRGAFEEMEEASTSGKDGKLDVRASKSGQDVIVHGTLDAELRVPCARCLEEFDLPVHADLSVIYAPAARVKPPVQPKAEKSDKGDKAATAKSGGKKRGAEAEEEYEFTSEEADTLGYDGETVVLDDLVRDELILGIPMIPLCSEACPGMSPAPGVRTDEPEEKDESAGIDPRLAPLLQFQANRAKETKS